MKILVCIIISSMAMCSTAAEGSSNEKNQKREILALGHSAGFGFNGLGHFGADLGFTHGLGFGYASTLVPNFLTSPFARTLAPIHAAPVLTSPILAAPIHAAPILNAPIHAPALSLAAPIKAHLHSEPIKAVITAPVASVVPTPFGFPYPTTVVAHNIPATVHIARPITAHIAPVQPVPISAVKIVHVPRLGHVHGKLYHH